MISQLFLKKEGGGKKKEEEQGATTSKTKKKIAFVDHNFSNFLSRILGF
jgi:hypothetical protein